MDETFEESSDLEQNPTSDLENLLPMLPELPEIVSESHQELPPAVTVIATPSPELPDLDDLF